MSKIVTPSTPLWKHILWAAVALLFLYALSQIPNTLIVFVTAWLIAYLLNPVVEAIEGKRIGPFKKCSRGLAVSIVAGILIGIVVAAGAMVMPQLSDQVQRLINLQSTISDPRELPQAINDKVEPILAKLPAEYRDEILSRSTTFVQESASTIGVWVSNAIRWLGTFLGELLSGIFLIMTAFLVSMYMLMTWKGMGEGALTMLPRQYRKEILSLSSKMQLIFGGYLKATIVTSLVCAFATFVSLWAVTFVTGIDFPYKGVVSFVAGLTYPIPFVGVIATSILGGVLGYVAEGSLGFAAIVLITLNVVNTIIDRTVQPKLMSDAMGVSELFVLFAAFAGGEIAGIWGMLLGIPVAAMGKTLFEWFHLNFLNENKEEEEEAAEVLILTEKVEVTEKQTREPESESAQEALSVESHWTPSRPDIPEPVQEPQADAQRVDDGKENSDPSERGPVRPESQNQSEEPTGAANSESQGSEKAGPETESPSEPPTTKPKAKTRASSKRSKGKKKPKDTK